jgi:flavoprotein
MFPSANGEVKKMEIEREHMMVDGIEYDVVVSRTTADSFNKVVIYDIEDELVLVAAIDDICETIEVYGYDSDCKRVDVGSVPAHNFDDPYELARWVAGYGEHI